MYFFVFSFCIFNWGNKYVFKLYVVDSGEGMFFEIRFLVIFFLGRLNSFDI